MVGESSRRKRTPTGEELAAWRVYIESGEMLRRALAAGFQSSAGLSAADYPVLLALDEAPERRLRSSALAEHAGWERSRMSHQLRRLEERGLIRRARAGRTADVILTDEGARVFRTASAAHLRLVRELFVDAFSSAELAAAKHVADRLQNHLRDVAAGR